MSIGMGCERQRWRLRAAAAPPMFTRLLLSLFLLFATTGCNALVQDDSPSSSSLLFIDPIIHKSQSRPIKINQLKTTLSSRALQQQTQDETTTTQDNEDTARFSQLTLRFSLWFPDLEEDDIDIEALSNDEKNPIRQAVLWSVLDTLCSEGSLQVMEYENGANFDSATDQDLCPSRPYKRSSSAVSTRTNNVFSNHGGRRHLQTDTSTAVPSIVEKNAQVAVRRRARERLTWTIWTLRYTVLQIGDIYIQEALHNQPDLLLSELSESSSEAMEQVMQLSLDVVIMEGLFDESLAATLDLTDVGNLAVHSSPIRKEYDTFSEIDALFYSTDSYDPPRISPMRVAGVALLISTIIAFFTLQHLASRRRNRIKRLEKEAHKKRLEGVDVDHADQSSLLEQNNKNNPQLHPCEVMLVSPQGVEDMLQKSAAPLALGVATTTPPTSSSSANNNPTTAKTATTTTTSPSPKEEASTAVNNEQKESAASRLKRRFFPGVHLRRRRSSADDNADAPSLDNVAVAINQDGTVESVLPTPQPLSATGPLVSEDDVDEDEDEEEGMMQLPQNLKL